MNASSANSAGIPWINSICGHTVFFNSSYKPCHLRYNQIILVGFGLISMLQLSNNFLTHVVFPHDVGPETVIVNGCWKIMGGGGVTCGGGGVTCGGGVICGGGSTIVLQSCIIFVCLFKSYALVNVFLHIVQKNMLSLQRLYLLMSSIAHILYFILGILTCYIILCYNCSYYYVRHVETQKARKTQFLTQFFILSGPQIESTGY